MQASAGKVVGQQLQIVADGHIVSQRQPGFTTRALPVGARRDSPDPQQRFAAQRRAIRPAQFVALQRLQLIEDAQPDLIVAWRRAVRQAQYGPCAQDVARRSLRATALVIRGEDRAVLADNLAQAIANDDRRLEFGPQLRPGLQRDRQTQRLTGMKGRQAAMRLHDGPFRPVHSDRLRQGLELRNGRRRRVVEQVSHTVYRVDGGQGRAAMRQQTGRHAAVVGALGEPLVQRHPALFRQKTRDGVHVRAFRQGDQSRRQAELAPVVRQFVTFGIGPGQGAVSFGQGLAVVADHAAGVIVLQGRVRRQLQVEQQESGR